MRITFVLPRPDSGGGMRVIAAYASRLQARGHKVVLVSTGPRVPSLGAKVKRWLGLGVQSDADHVKGSHLQHLELDWRPLDWHRPVVDSDLPDADVVVATWWETAEWVAALSPRKGAKVYLLQHDESIFEGQPAERVRATWRLPMCRVAVSRWIADRVEAEAGTNVMGQGVAVINNSVDGELFDAPPRCKQPRPTFGFMYSPDFWKGTDLAVAAVDQLRGEHPEIRVVAFGSLAPTADLPLPEGVEYEVRPAQTRIASIYACCDAWLFCSRAEGFGLPILEAMACRTPVIGAPAGAAPQLLGDGCGLLLEKADAPLIASAMKRVIAMDDGAWRAMSASAYARAHGRTWDQAADAFEAMLREASEATDIFGASNQVLMNGTETPS